LIGIHRYCDPSRQGKEAGITPASFFVRRGAA
jgi:hypothetical protein